MARLRILFVSEYFYPKAAGGEVWSWELCCALAAKGYEVTVITTRIDGTRPDERIKGVRILRPVNAGKGRVTRKLSSIRLAGYVENYLESQQPGIVHVNAFTMNVAVSKAAKRLGIPCITAVHSYFGDDWKSITMIGPVIKRMERSTIKRDRSAIMHVPSEYLRKRIKKDTGKETKVVSNWLPDRFPKPRRFRRPTLLFVGSLEPVKNPLACVAVAKRLGMPLVVIGKGSLEEDLLKEAQRAGIDCAVVPGATREDTLAAIGGAALVLVPSVTESFSLVALEAVAQGTPVSGTPVGIIPGLRGTIPFPPKSVPKRLNAETRRALKERYAKDRIIPLFERFYAKLASRDSR